MLLCCVGDIKPAGVIVTMPHVPSGSDKPLFDVDEVLFVGEMANPDWFYASSAREDKHGWIPSDRVVNLEGNDRPEKGKEKLCDFSQFNIMSLPPIHSRHSFCFTSLLSLSLRCFGDPLAQKCALFQTLRTNKYSPHIAATEALMFCEGSAKIPLPTKIRVQSHQCSHLPYLNWLNGLLTLDSC